MEFTIKKVFHLEDNQTVISIESFYLSYFDKIRHWTIWINGVELEEIHFVGPFLLKGVQKHSNEYPMQVKEALTALKGIDFSANEVILKADGGWKFHDNIEEAIAWDKPIEEQLEALSQFDDLSEDEMRQLPRFIKSQKVGMLIEYLGHEKLRNYLPDCLMMLQDINWPASRGASKMLVKAGSLMFDEIQRVFEKENDVTWNVWILLHVVDCWDKPLIEAFTPVLLELIPKALEDSIQALRILGEQQILSKEEIKSHYDDLRVKGKEYDYFLQDLEEEISPLLT